jgi:exodeoxyribonuclease-3
VTSEKYQYKLNWLKHCATFLKADLSKHPKYIVLGDFNIAPQEIDVCDPAYWDGQVLFSAPERQAFKDLLAMGFTDCYRQLHPSEPAYSWWDYRMNAFKRNKGLRIDHVLASSSLAPHCTNSSIDKAPRAWERPSDHAPVIAKFDIQ